MANRRSMLLFHRAADELPAYKQFLAKHGVKPAAVTDPTLLSKVPTTSKKGYLVKYDFEQLVWPQELESPLLFCATSGSTGDPYYFPRNEKLSWQYSHAIEDFLKYSSYGQGSTLVLLGFGTGVWIGGVITLRAFEIAGQRMKAPIRILPVGYNKVEIFKALRKLSPQFDQTLIIGYPPFVKEIVDEAPREKVKLKKLNVRFMFAAEAFTESFRNYLCKKAGIADPVRDTMNIYGSADIGAMAYETPLSILIRRVARENPKLYMEMFGQIDKTPTLAQYRPDFIDFEEQNGEVLLTADGALPLIRYAVGDHGGVFSYEQINSLMLKYNVNLLTEIQKAGIEDIVEPRLPFVYVYERIDLSVTLHGINIYPEYVKEELLRPEITDYFTQRFTMSTKYDLEYNQFIQINIELQKDIKPTKLLTRRVLRLINAAMIAKSSEFSEVSKSKKGAELIQVVLWPNGDPRYFAPGTKQKWVEKA